MSATDQRVIAQLQKQIADQLSALPPETLAVARARILLPAAPSPRDWLASQSLRPRLYIADRDDRRQLAAIGSADQMTSVRPVAFADVFAELQEVLDHGPDDLKYFGGCRFDRQRPCGTEWQDFGDCRFFIPRFELHVSQGMGQLVCNVVHRPGADHAQLQARLDREFATLAAAPLAGRRPATAARRVGDSPDRRAWDLVVREILELIADGELAKCVAARVSRFDFADAPSPDALLEALHQITPGCFHFLFQPERDAAFFGATPEMLYYRQDRRLEVAAIAGTRRRGSTTEEDERLAQDLLHNDKERREHRCVADTIQSALEPLCRGSRIDSGVSVLKLSGLQHLCQTFTGELYEQATDADLLAALHPTPAVGGSPTAAALAELRRLEPFDRGWYAAPLGWFSRASTGFAVGIRSALLQGRALQVYAGAGIVSGSDPAREWSELENKIGAFLRVITPDNG